MKKARPVAPLTGELFEDVGRLFRSAQEGLCKMENGGVTFARRILNTASLVFWPFSILHKQNLMLFMTSDPNVLTISDLGDFYA